MRGLRNEPGLMKRMEQMEMRFETERLIIRKFRTEDALALYENHSDDEV